MKFTSGLLTSERKRFEKWFGEPLEPPIVGCGHWGCVVLGASGDKLLKLTVDPAEPHLAHMIQGLQAEDSARGEMVRAGVVKIHRVAKIRGKVWKYGRNQDVYVISREAVIPIQDAASRGKSDPLALWLRARRRRKAARTELELQLQQNMQELELDGQVIQRPPGWVSERTKNILDDIVETLEAADKCQTARARARRETDAIGQMGDLASYPEGETLGEAMIALLAGFDVPLRDVHMGNIGLRIEPTSPEVPTPALVLFDFGHAELRRVPMRRLGELSL